MDREALDRINTRRRPDGRFGHGESPPAGNVVLEPGHEADGTCSHSAPPYMPPRPARVTTDCPDCDSYGFEVCRDRDGTEDIDPHRPCRTCHGSGEVDRHDRRLDRREQLAFHDRSDAPLTRREEDELAATRAGCNAPMPTPADPFELPQTISTARWSTLSRLSQQDTWWEGTDGAAHHITDLTTAERFTALAELDRFLNHVNIAGTPLYQALAAMQPPRVH